ISLTTLNCPPVGAALLAAGARSAAGCQAMITKAMRASQRSSRNLVEFMVTSSKLVRRTENYRSFDTHHCGPGPRRAPLEREHRALGRCDSQTTWLNRMR